MIVAGIGSRKGVAAEEVIALIERALVEANVERASLSAVVTAEAKAEERGIIAAAEALNVPFQAISHDRMHAAQNSVTRSLQSERLFGVSSVSETSALAAAGEGSTLVLARIVSASATCALARAARRGESA